MITEIFAGLRGALRARWRAFVVASVLVAALSVAVPVAVLSLVRKPFDFFTFNPWLSRLPEYLGSPEHDSWTKAGKLWNLVLFWFSADSPYGGTEWGFAVEVRDVVRIAVTSALVGLYFALWRERRAMLVPPAGVAAGRAGGMAGGLAAVFGLSTGPCSVVGCGAPVLPVVGLAFTGLSSGALKLLAGLSTVATGAILVVLVGATGHLARRVGAVRRRG